MPTQTQEVSRTPNRHVKNETSLLNIIFKTLSTENKDRVLKAVRQKHQSPIKINPS
jgi:hypothetical protein